MRKICIAGALGSVLIASACEDAEGVSGALEVTAAHAIRHNPLGDLEAPHAGEEQFRGRVVEIVGAGRYTYASIETAPSKSTWVVTMSPGLGVGMHVDVKNMGIHRNFESRRLRRTFDVLVFGIVRPADAGSSTKGRIEG